MHRVDSSKWGYLGLYRMCRGYMRCIEADGVPGEQGHGGRLSSSPAPVQPSPAGRCASLLHHLVMETEIASGFRQAGRRTCAGREDSRPCGVVPGWEESNPPGGAALLAKAAPGEAALSRSDGFELVPGHLRPGRHPISAPAGSLALL